MRSALNCSQPDGAVPVWELSFHLWNKFSRRSLILGDEFNRLSCAEQERTLYSNAEIIVSVANDLKFAAVTSPSGYWETAPGRPAYYWLPDDVQFRQIEILLQLAGDDFLVVGESGGVMCMPPAHQYEEFCYKLFDSPEEIDQMAQNCLQRGLETVKRLRDMKVEIIMTGSDIADNHGPFFNPEQMDRFILPYLNRWAKEIASLGALSIMHSDGNLTPCLESLADTALNALQAIDPVAGMNIQATKEQVKGRLCLCGNIDCGLLLTGTSEQVYESTRSLLEDCKLGGGFVLGASNAVQEEVQISNYKAMLEAWKEHGQYS